MSNDKESTSNVSHVPFESEKINEWRAFEIYIQADRRKREREIEILVSNFRLSKPFDFSSDTYSSMKHAGFMGTDNNVERE